MSWVDLLFAHWPVSPDVVRSKLPVGVELDLFDGQAWIGVVPFRMEDVGPRGMSWLSPFSHFAEINVRTYVTVAGKPGVWFFSLDAASSVAVRAARVGFRLPYHRADIDIASIEDWVVYDSRRRSPPGRFRGRYRPISPPYTAKSGSLDAWLTDRYCLYTVDRRRRIWRGEVHHRNWPLQAAQLHLEINTVADAHGLPLVGEAPLLHFSRRLDVVAWWLERARGGAAGSSCR